MSSIYSIVYQPEDKKYEGNHVGDYIREPLQQASLVADHGISGDAKAGKSPSRQLNLLSLAWLDKLKALGYHTEPGQFGEQIIVEGLAVEDLQAGERLKIGESAVIEITKPRTGCERLQAAQGRPNDPFDNLVGMLAKVISGGEISVGDRIRKIS